MHAALNTICGKGNQVAKTLLSASYSSTPPNPQHVLNGVTKVEEVQLKEPAVGILQSEPFRVFINQVTAFCDVVNETKVVEQTPKNENILRRPFFIFSTDKDRYYEQIRLSRGSDAYDTGANRIADNDEDDRLYSVTSTVLTKEQIALALNADDTALKTNE